MLYLLRRHPFRVVAHFDFSLAVTLAYPQEIIKPLLPPGLELDEYGGYGFVAIALVQVRKLRPAVLPSVFGSDFFLAGYRIFTRFRNRQGRRLRGLYILRSDADKQLMVTLGSLLTNYRYTKSHVTACEATGKIAINILSPHSQADLDLIADVSQPAMDLPKGSPFPDWQTARLYAGPLPFTFGYEPQTNSMILVQGHREAWTPMPVIFTIKRATFLDSPPFNQARPILSNAFIVRNVSYSWDKGIREPLAH
jgi:uncharacterized protein DUF2071